MILTQCYTGSLSQASYLVADEVTGQAVIVDPLRDVEQYLVTARDQGLTIVGVILTHFHADFVAGHLELAKATGAWIGLGDRARAEFVARLLADGERISLGEVTLEILASPGHTPESISILVYERADDEVAYGVLTGDSLFVGDVGRVDLQAIFGADPLELAKEQFDTIQNRFMSLPDEVRVFPAHGAGSACGKNLSPDRESTIGRERRTNPACQPMSEESFVASITEGQVSVPAYFVKDAALNRQVHDLFDAERGIRSLTREEVLDQAALDRSLIIDTRDAESFVHAHLPGALNVPLDGRFAETAGMFLEFEGRSVILVSQGGEEREAMRQLARIGYDDVRGFVPEELFNELSLEGLLVESERIDAGSLDLAHAPEALILLDVRGAGEYETGSIPGSINIPLAELPARVSELRTDGPVVVNCASGWRSAVATSYLNGHGFSASDIRGGYQAWAKAAA